MIVDELATKLREAAGGWVKAKASRMDVSGVRALGYEVEEDAARGFRIPRPPEKLVPFEIRLGLRAPRLGREIVCVESVTSTNDVCWQAVKYSAPEGLVVAAEEQTAGRGRFGRVWHSPRGLGLAVSVLLRPAISPDRLPLLTAAAAVAAAEVAGGRIRWPNDVVARGRKIAGIIVEGKEPGAFVLGCGMNVNLAAADFPPELRDVSTSLLLETGRRHDRNAVLRDFLGRLEIRYEEALAGAPALAEAWKSMSALLGRRVAVAEAGKNYSGEVVDVDVIDGVSLRLADTGTVRRFRLEHVEKLTEAQ